MSPAGLIDQLSAVGIRLGVEGDALHADVLPGVNVTPYTETIRRHRPALIAELRLRERIIAAATVEPAHFNRSEYDLLWDQWHEENPT